MIENIRWNRCFVHIKSVIVDSGEVRYSLCVSLSCSKFVTDMNVEDNGTIMINDIVAIYFCGSLRNIIQMNTGCHLLTNNCNMNF